MTIDDFTRQRITVAVDDPEIASMRVGRGWICEVVDCGLIPIAVIAMIRHIERQKQKEEK